MTTILMTIMCLLGVVAAAKKKQPRWLQMTLTGGAPKGAVDWLKPNTKIEPSTVQFGKAEDVRDSGFHIPDFVDDATTVVVLIDRNDSTRRPLLIYQKTAMVATLMWLAKITHQTVDDGMGIETITTDEPWLLHFKRGKGKFDPYTMTADDITEGGA